LGLSRVTLVLGGARSGKSSWAERRAAASGRPVLYLATATAGDEEMAERIAAHRAARPPTWRTAEAPLEVVAALETHARPGDVVLLDCLTLWVSNALLSRLGDGAEGAPPAAWRLTEEDLVTEATGLVAGARELGVDLIAVSNEVGLGLVPPYPLGRRFRDALGRVNQAVAAAADTVVLMVAGLPVDLRKLAPE
jgi:adenosylcobinamide kinase/adenosylcobinamide-phosphate guanylyltransferase